MRKPKRIYPRFPVKKNGLSKRQLHILSCVGEGMTNKAMGIELGVSDKTIDYHIRQIQDYMNLHCRYKLIRLAIGFHLCSPL